MAVNDPEWFTVADLAQMRDRGVDVDEALRQLRQLRSPPTYADLDRPCTLGDGLESVAAEVAEEILARGREAMLQGRCTKFVPASGAATRMFRDLARFHEAYAPLTEAGLQAAEAAGEDGAVEARAFLNNVREFAFATELEQVASRAGGSLEAFQREGRHAEVLAALLAADGLAYAGRPKALLPFHRYPGGSRTAFEEHLVEAADLVRDARGVCRLHFTVSPEHREAFQALLRDVGPALERRYDARFDVTFSVQKPSTDTLAVDLRGRPFRATDGGLLFRASGHGALLSNLADLRADLVLVKNVDNIAPDRLREPTHRWSLLLLGLLAGLQERMFALLRRLEDATDAQAPHEAAAFCRRELLQAPPDPTAADARARLIDALHRPARVCGMVPNAGEPGGGPFWVRGPGGTTRQIVESAQVDPDSPEQRRRFASGTHFNPVFLACGVRDHQGRPFVLERYVDAEAVLATRKSAGGRELLALERPGLWNGAMAGWNTVFVQVPPIVFNPVKTVSDLLREAHRSAVAPDPA